MSNVELKRMTTNVGCVTVTLDGEKPVTMFGPIKESDTDNTCIRTVLEYNVLPTLMFDMIRDK